MSEDVDDMDTFHILVKLEVIFSEDVFETHFYSFQDMISAIGGILATINAAGKVLLMITISVYVLSFAQVL